MRDQAITEVNTPTSAHIITRLALEVFSSSPLDTRYMIHPIIIAITAITAIYLITAEIIFAINTYTPSPSPESAAVPHHGRLPQFTSGAAKITRGKNVRKLKIYTINFFFI